MSDTKLHKLKGKTRRNIIKETPLKVKKFFDRKCGCGDYWICTRLDDS